ncbi:hypothetical protein DSECCO2_608680 [anaerobic digester metagenome]
MGSSGNTEIDVHLGFHCYAAGSDHGVFTLSPAFIKCRPGAAGGTTKQRCQFFKLGPFFLAAYAKTATNNNLRFIEWPSGRLLLVYSQHLNFVAHGSQVAVKLFNNSGSFTRLVFLHDATFDGGHLRPVTGCQNVAQHFSAKSGDYLNKLLVFINAEFVAMRCQPRFELCRNGWCKLGTRIGGANENSFWFVIIDELRQCFAVQITAINIEF